MGMTKAELEKVHQAFIKTFKGEGELWFTYYGNDEEMMEPVNEYWDKLLEELHRSNQ